METNKSQSNSIKHRYLGIARLFSFAPGLVSRKKDLYNVGPLSIKNYAIYLAWVVCTFFILSGVASLSHAQENSVGVDINGPVQTVAGINKIANATNENIGEIKLELSKTQAMADGQSAIEATVRLFDTKGKPITDTRYIGINTDGGRLVLADDLARRAEGFASIAPRITDQAVVRRQLKIEAGVAKFQLIAPDHPQDVRLRLAAGGKMTNAVISFLPELREMMMVGLVEGIISKRSIQTSDIGQAHINDGFEREINRWSRSLGNDTRAAVRTAFFLKGTVKGDVLLTAAYDSDKETKNNLMRDVSPERFYPVYGDNSTRGFEARSSDRLYVRIDSQKSYLLYGDFATGDGFSQATGGGGVANQKQRDLGSYSRTATGVRGHYEKDKIVVNSFAIYDSLKQIVEEYGANGTSGPYAVKNINAIENSEKIEILIRDKNQLGLIKQINTLTRYIDYTFEPFSGRILFTQPIATLAPNGDPQFIRITYEAEQGGDNFWVVGTDAQMQVTPTLNIGGAIIEDKNPLSPYRLASGNLSVKLGEKASLVAEFAQSDSKNYQANGTNYAIPSGQSGEMSSNNKGSAQRIEFNYAGNDLQGKAYYIRTDPEFQNDSASMNQGRGEAGLKGNFKISDKTTVFGEAIRSEDRTAQTSRYAGQIGVAHQYNDRLNVQASVSYIKEDSTIAPMATIANNSALSGISNTGGFFGGSSSQIVQNSSWTPATTSLSQPLEAVTAKVGAQYQVTDKFSVNGAVENGLDNTKQRRLVLGSNYQISKDTRLYNRFETQSGLASAYSLAPADKSTSFTAGVSSAYMPGGNVFSEYRMQNSVSGEEGQSLRDATLATGERHTWDLAEGVVAQTGVEYLRVLQGQAQSALALTAGIDYAANPLWRASTKLEYRRLFSTPVGTITQGQNQWLSTAMFARKLAKDWTLLLRNYLLYSEKNVDATGAAVGNAIQDRAQVGFAWRPTDNNRFNALARYEYKVVKDNSSQNGDNYQTHIISMHGDYHPSRPWWANLHLAAKDTRDFNLPVESQRYTAWLASGRVTYDINKKWDIGALFATLNSPQGNSQQYAYGLEIGYLLHKNLWLSAGYNLSGFTDQDLTGSEYTAKGIYLRLRFKFDEDILKSKI